MKVVYATQPLPQSITRSIFLAGPTPRGPEAESWRPHAISLLQEIGFDGTVFVPESEDGIWRQSYTDQVEWEELCLNAADCIVFWIPRNLETMPAFTTNIEFGAWQSSGKCIVGAPEDAPKMSYIKHYVEKSRGIFFNSLIDTLKEACRFTQKGAERWGGARMVPLHVYNTPHFQNWFTALKEADNRLDDARLLWNFRVGKQLDYPLFWAMQVNVHVTRENRNKTNEVIVSRPNISSIVAWHKKGSTILETEVCMVEEFRSPVTSWDGFVLELPGGSSPKPEESPQSVAAKEFEEETGLKLPEDRFALIGTRQLASTSITHSAALFGVELSLPEIEFLKTQQGVPHGEDGSSERTYVRVLSFAEILASGKCDWANLGMILSSI